MSYRIKLGRMLLRLGAFIQSLPVVVLKPVDLIEFGRQTYARPQNLEGWVEDSLVDSGLSLDELELLKDLPVKTGELLLLGVGGGREAIPLARMGFYVTGVDFVEDMVSHAKENAFRRGITIKGLTQEISQLDIPENTFDVIWLSRAMYSCVPTRARRVEMVRRITRALKPGGFFLCQFHFDPRVIPSKKVTFLRRLIAFLTFGNLSYETGDILWLNVEFIHAFSNENEVRKELEEGGLTILEFQKNQNPIQCGVVCRKNNNNELLDS